MDSRALATGQTLLLAMIAEDKYRAEEGSGNGRIVRRETSERAICASRVPSSAPKRKAKRAALYTQKKTLLFYAKVALTDFKSPAPFLATLLRRCSGVVTQNMIREATKPNLDK